MEISQVIGTLVCTQRISGLERCSLRVLKDGKGRLSVATDPVGARAGNWVFTVSGSAARYAMGDPGILTDLTIGGIIDDWGPGALAQTRPQPAAAASTEDRDTARAA